MLLRTFQQVQGCFWYADLKVGEVHGNVETPAIRRLSPNVHSTGYSQRTAS